MTKTAVKPHAAKPTSPRNNTSQRRERDRKAAEKRREQLAAHLASGATTWTPKRSNGLTFADMFCGAGGSSIGFANAGFRLLAALNHWQTAIDTHGANFPDSEHLCVDIDEYDLRYIPRGADVLWASPLCFPAGTTILTRQGATPIEAVQVGDEVLTHAGRWRRVTKFIRNVSDTVIVKGHGHNELEATPEHPFYARHVERVWNNEVRDYRKQFGDREWVEAKNLNSHYWATPTSFGDPMPVPVVGGRGLKFTEAFWWMVGRWLGDGYVRIQDDEPQPLPRVPRRGAQPAGSGCIVCGNPARPDGRSATGRVSPYCSNECKRANSRVRPTRRRHDIYICCGDHEADVLHAKLAAVAPTAATRAGQNELRWRQSHPSTVTVFETSHAGLATWLVEQFGRHAHGKRIPAWVLTMPEVWRRALLDGYLSADGNINLNKAQGTTMARFSTVSRPLAVGVRLLAVSLGHGASMYAPGRRDKGTIEGRSVAMRPSWSVGWATNPDQKHLQTVDDGLHRWSKVRSVRDGRRQVEVFNLSVEEDESYIADGIVVHNCTELSPAGGNTRVKRDDNGYLAEVEELGHVSKKGQVRTRATFYDVLRATEVHRFKAVIVENVPDAVDWELFDVWLAGMDRLGYRWQLVSVNSAHVGGDGIPHAPQWRDRLYIVFVRKDIGRKPDVTPAPLSWCGGCAKTVKGVQTWAPSVVGRRHMVGRYRRIANSSYGQYWYTCPQRGCRSRVEPYVLPAVAALDMTDVGVRIGDLPRTLEKPEGLKPKTMARIRQGLRMYGDPFYMKNHNGFVEPHRMVKPVGSEPLGTMTTGRSHSLVTPFTVNSNHDDTRVSPVGETPLSARTTKIGDGLVVPPMLVPAGGTWADKPLDALMEPSRTVLANEKGCEALVTPGAFLAMLRNNGGMWPVGSHPMPTLTAGGTHHALIVPYYSKGGPSTTVDPLGTISTRDRYAMVGASQLARMAELDAMDAFYRMLKPRESLRAQTFPDDYIVLGGSGEQTMQAGNAVSCNVAQWIGERVADVLLPHPA